MLKAGRTIYTTVHISTAMCCQQQSSYSNTLLARKNIMQYYTYYTLFPGNNGIELFQARGKKITLKHEYQLAEEKIKNKQKTNKKERSSSNHKAMDCKIIQWSNACPHKRCHSQCLLCRPFCSVSDKGEGQKKKRKMFAKRRKSMGCSTTTTSTCTPSRKNK